jgi:excisionase family DNA binding protein
MAPSRCKQLITDTVDILNEEERTMMREKRVIPPVAYRVEEAAEALRLSRDKVYELIRSGELRSIKVGSRRLVPVVALTEYVEKSSGDAA